MLHGHGQVPVEHPRVEAGVLRAVKAFRSPPTASTPPRCPAPPGSGPLEQQVLEEVRESPCMRRRSSRDPSTHMPRATDGARRSCSLVTTRRPRGSDGGRRPTQRRRGPGARPGHEVPSPIERGLAVLASQRRWPRSRSRGAAVPSPAGGRGVVAIRRSPPPMPDPRPEQAPSGTSSSPTGTRRSGRRWSISWISTWILSPVLRRPRPCRRACRACPA